LEVLRTMRESGDISDAEFEQALAEPLPERLPAPESTGAPYFTDYVRSQLEADYPLNSLASEGFRIFTTLDPSLQRDAERAVRDGLAALEKAHPELAKDGEAPEALLLAIQPHSGEIKVMVGGRSYETSQFNRVTDAQRQPGSIFKPIVLLAAMEDEEQKGARRFLPTRKVLDAPFTWKYEGRSWSPENYKGEYRGEVTLRQALEQSLNAATARLGQEVGLDRVQNVATRIGFREDLPKLPAIVLGGVEVTALEVARAFATIANLGFRADPSSIRSVLDTEGSPIVRRTLGASQAVSPRVAYLVSHLMEGVVDRGTARAVRAAGIRFPVAGKTGTTNDGRDAWFVGFTPDLLAVVWVGFDRERSLGLSGAQAALPIWIEFMKAAYAGNPGTAFLVPPGIATAWIDPASGELATSRCPTRLEEAFLEGEAPGVYCPLHPETLPAFDPRAHLPVLPSPPPGHAVEGSERGFPAP
jgi:penicillin-binding protein 1B